MKNIIIIFAVTLAVIGVMTTGLQRFNFSTSHVMDGTITEAHQMVFSICTSDNCYFIAPSGTPMNINIATEYNQIDNGTIFTFLSILAVIIFLLPKIKFPATETILALTNQKLLNSIFLRE